MGVGRPTARVFLGAGQAAFILWASWKALTADSERLLTF